MIPATVAAPLYFRPVGSDLYEVVRYGQAAGRVRWTGTGFDAYTITGTRVAQDVPVMTAAADAIVAAEVETFLASYSTPKAREVVARTLREGGHLEHAAAIEATLETPPVAVTPTTAQAVSATLRRAGFLPVPPGREGIRVSRGLQGTASVAVSLDGLPTREARMATDAREVLTEAGYVLEDNPNAGNLFTVRGRRA